MSTVPNIDLGQVARGLKLGPGQVQCVVHLLDDGNTVPFITRYRKDQTGGLHEEQIRDIQDQVAKLRALAERKQTILRSIESQGKLTPELASAIEAANTARRLEDLYLPFKPKKQTLATVARERGLEPLAIEILEAQPSVADLDARAKDFVNPDRGVPTAADALLGAGHILAESFSERADLRQRLRDILQRTGKLVSTHAESDEKAAEKKGTGFRDYFDFHEDLKRIPPHRVLAINRGEKAKILRVKIEADTATIEQVTDELLVPPEHPHAAFLRGCARDALARLVLPSLEREFRRELTERAETHAVGVFAQNLRNLLLQPPVRGRRVLAIDPGLKSGCKLAALDEFGNLLEHGIVHLLGKDEARQEAKAKLIDFATRHQLSVVVVGNGTGCRETEELVAELIAGELASQSLAYVIVNEAGASVYSTSQLAREEFPGYDATLRGTMSIGRRLQDPLSELVKIDPPNLGVGLYQHDVKAKHLRASLDAVVESCVNYVGVDLNTASPALLRYVSGLNQLTARRLYEHRQTHGPFTNREQLKDVSGFGEVTFIQAVGFLKISGGDNPLDATWIHPESYTAAQRVLTKLDCSLADLAEKKISADLAQRAAALDRAAFAAELGVGVHLLDDILSQLTRPGRDPREDLPTPIFKKGILKLEDLTAGMELSGTVLNVVDFGAFVDIGLHDSGLVHVSQLANKFVRDPHAVVAVGDIVKVWVMEVDKARRRVSLTMIPPGSERAREERRPAKPDQGAKAEQGDRPAGGRPAGRPPAQRRPADQGGRRDRGRKPHSQGPPAPPPKPKPKPKPVVPLTKAMKEGKAPLRTFGDLKQFLQLKSEPDPEPGEQAG
ncbi:MAG: Tex family protein [Pirellulales bacterium]